MTGPIHPYFGTPMYHEDDDFLCEVCRETVSRDDVDWDTWMDNYDGAPDAVNPHTCLRCRDDS